MSVNILGVSSWKGLGKSLCVPWSSLSVSKVERIQPLKFRFSLGFGDSYAQGHPERTLQSFPALSRLGSALTSAAA